MVDSGVVCDDFFVIIKIWIENFFCDKFFFSFKESLYKLCFDQVDLMLIYWFFFQDELLVVDYLQVLVEVKVQGFMCLIGIFNFIIVYMEQVIVVVGVEVIVINQVEIYFFLQNCKVVDFVCVKGIYLMVYMLLVYGKVMEDVMLLEIVVCYGVLVV